MEREISKMVEGNPQDQFVMDLPQEIILSIISRLPVKSIIDCMLVCKYWLNQISNPFVFKSNSVYFVLYYEKSTRFSILDHEEDHSLEYYCTCYSKDRISLMKPCFPNRCPPVSGFIAILASCNGLVCFSQSVLSGIIKYIRIYVCNPIIGECVAIPEPSLNSFSDYLPPAIRSLEYSFGFCPVTDQYKVLKMIIVDDDRDLLVHNIGAEIYTLGSKEWRRIGDFPEMMRKALSSVPPVCLGGVLHWICGDLVSPETQSILTFNLTAEEFGTATLPPIEYDEKVYVLGCMDGCLIATAGCYGNLGSGMSVWVMKEGSWSRSWHIHDDKGWLGHPTVRGYGLEFTVPVAESPRGWILVKHGKRELHSFDPKEGEGVRRMIPDRLPQPHWSATGVFRHTATLVSPKDLMKGCEVVKGRFGIDATFPFHYR